MRGDCRADQGARMTTVGTEQYSESDPRATYERNIRYAESRVKSTLEDAVRSARLSERESCARLAEGPIFGLEHGTPEGVEIGRLIRERK